MTTFKDRYQVTEAAAAGLTVHWRNASHTVEMRDGEAVITNGDNWTGLKNPETNEDRFHAEDFYLPYVKDQYKWIAMRAAYDALQDAYYTAQTKAAAYLRSKGVPEDIAHISGDTLLVCEIDDLTDKLSEMIFEQITTEGNHVDARPIIEHGEIHPMQPMQHGFYSLKGWKSEYRLQADRGDAWGSAMIAFFTLANELYMRGADIPSEWGYSPGMVDDPREPEDYFYDMFRMTGEFMLLEIGNLLHRYTEHLKYHGEDY